MNMPNCSKGGSIVGIIKDVIIFQTPINSILYFLYLHNNWVYIVNIIVHGPQK